MQQKSHKGQNLTNVSVSAADIITYFHHFDDEPDDVMMMMIQASMLLFYHVCFISALKLPPTPPLLRRANDLSSLVYFYSKTSLYETVEIAIRISVIKIWHIWV